MLPKVASHKPQRCSILTQEVSDAPFKALKSLPSPFAPLPPCSTEALLLMMLLTIIHVLAAVSSLIRLLCCILATAFDLRP